MNKPNWEKTVVWIPLMVMAAFAAGLWFGGAIWPGRQNGLHEKFDKVLQYIENQYVDEVNIDSLLDETIPDLLSHLDPHTVYIPAEDLIAANEELEGSFSGIGISFNVVQDSITVVEVLSGGPAEKVGLLAGDRIVAIDDSVATGKKWTYDKVRSSLRGTEGSKVKLGIRRATAPDEVLEFTLTRGQIPVTSVDAAYRLSDKVAYIKVNKFGAQTYSDFLNAIATVGLDPEGQTALIIDLRGNGGGFMEPAVLMANEFLQRGQTIVSTRGRLLGNPGGQDVIYADGAGSFANTPLVVLVDEYSASASEIFAGAVQDNDRGLVVGRRSFGKGLVQNQFTLPDSSAIRVTVARYFTPSGRCIQKQYIPGSLADYSAEIYDRYSHGEFAEADSIHFDPALEFKTLGGRSVYGGGGIIPDVFVANDTTAITSYYLQVVNAGLMQKFAFSYADRHRANMRNAKTVAQLNTMLPSDDILLREFVDYTTSQGVAPRWYYINISRPLIVSYLRALIARDVVGAEAFYHVINRDDNVILRALDEINRGNAAIPIKQTLSSKSNPQK